MILSISSPVLNAVYPVAIVLILLGLSHGLWKDNPYVYPMTVSGTGVLSVLYALDEAGLPLGVMGGLLHKLPLYGLGFGWIWTAAGMLVLALLAGVLSKEKCALANQ